MAGVPVNMSTEGLPEDYLAERAKLPVCVVCERPMRPAGTMANKRVPGPGEIMLMLTHWRHEGEDWADEAYCALVSRFPGLDVDRDTDGGVVLHPEEALFALHKAESDVLCALRFAWNGALDSSQ